MEYKLTISPTVKLLNFLLTPEVFNSVVGIWAIEDFKSGVLPAKIVEKEQKILQKLIY